MRTIFSIIYSLDSLSYSRYFQYTAKMQDVCGLTLTYQNSLFPVSSANLLLTPTHLLGSTPVSIGKGEQIATCMFYTQNTIIVGLSQPNEILFLDSADYHEITRGYLQGEPAALQVFGDFVVAFLRDKQALSVFTLSTFNYLNTLASLLPQGAPFVPHFMTADYEYLVFECGMRVFSLRAVLTSSKSLENKTISNCSFYIYEVAAGAICGSFCDKYLVLGYSDSTLQVYTEKEGTYMSNSYEIDVSSVLADGLSGVPLRDCLVRPQSFLYRIATISLPQVLPKTVISPRFGISAVCADPATYSAYIATRGGLVVKMKFMLDLKHEQLEELYEDSADSANGGGSTGDDESAGLAGDESAAQYSRYKTALNGNYISTSVYPTTVYPYLKFQACSNLNLDLLLAGTAASASQSSVLSQASALQEESAAWSDARSCCELLNFSFSGATHKLYSVVYDPVCNCAYPIEFDDFAAEHCLLQSVRLLGAHFISAFAPVYYYYVPALKKHLLQVYDYMYYKTQHTKKVSLLSLASGSLKTDDSELFIANQHVPSTVYTNSLRILRFYVSAMKFAYSARRCVCSTREGHIYVFCYETAEQEVREELVKNYNGVEEIKTQIYSRDAVSGFKIIANCKIIDAILDLDISPTGTLVVAACTDAVRVFTLNGNYLVCQHEISIKMASKVLFPPTGFVVNVIYNNCVHYIDPQTGLVINQLQGHNDVIYDCQYLAPTTLRDTFLATVDADGVLYIWDRRGKRVMEHVTRSKVTSLAPFFFGKTPKPHYCAMAADGVIKIFDLLGGNFVYCGAVQNALTTGFSAVKTLLFDFVKQAFICSDYFGVIHVVASPSYDMLRALSLPLKPVPMVDSSYAIGENRFSVCKQAQTQMMQQAQSPQPYQQVAGSPEDIYKHFDTTINCVLTQSPDLKYICVTGVNAPSTVVLYRFSEGFHSCIRRHVKEIDVLGDKNIDDYAFVDKCYYIDQTLFARLQTVLGYLNQRKIEIRLEFDHTVKVVYQRHQRALEQQKTQSESEIQQARTTTREITQTAEYEAEEFEKELVKIGREHSEQLQKIEREYRAKVGQIEVQKQHIIQQIQFARESHESQLKDLWTSREGALEASGKEFDARQARLRTEHYQLYNKLQQCMLEAKEAQNQADYDADTQIQELIGRNKAQMDLKQQYIDAILAETGMIRNKFASIRKQILTFYSNVTTCDNNIQALQYAVFEYQQELKTAEKEVQQRQDSIVQREKHIYELKNQAKELEKHRFVLDYKIKDLRKQIQPREQEIHDLTEYVREIGMELENYHKAIDQLDHQIQDARDEESRLKKGLVGARDALIKTRQSLYYFSYETNRIIEDHGYLSYEQLRDRLQPLLTFGGEQRVDEEQQKADNEKAKHKAFLQQAARELSRQINQGKDDVVQENQRIIEENTELLKEAAVLRREIYKIIHAPVSQQNTENSKVFQARLTAQDAEIKRLKKRVVELDEMQE